MWKRVAVWVGKNVVMRFYSLVGRLFLWPILYMEYRYQKPAGRAGCNERPVEYLFALKWLTRLCPQEVLDVGCGRSAWPEIVAKCGFHVTAIDKIRGYWRGDFFNRHYYVQNQDVTRPTLTREFDFITCLSVLEHIPDHHAAMEGMFRLLKPGGHLVLSFPYNEETYVDNIYQRPGVAYGRDYSFICQVYSRQQIDDWLRDGRGRIVDQAYYEVFTGDLWAFGERICPPREVEKGHKCHLTCLVIQRT
jgi:SAM-dependent methyltransferase